MHFCKWYKYRLHISTYCKSETKTNYIWFTVSLEFHEGLKCWNSYCSRHCQAPLSATNERGAPRNQGVYRGLITASYIHLYMDFKESNFLIISKHNRLYLWRGASELPERKKFPCIAIHSDKMLLHKRICSMHVPILVGEYWLSVQKRFSSIWTRTKYNVDGMMGLLSILHIGVVCVSWQIDWKYHYYIQEHSEEMHTA